MAAGDDLKQSYLFKNLELNVLEQLEKVSVRESVESGERIIRFGQANDSLWVFLKGDAVIRDELPGGLEMDLHRLQPGDIFGEMSYLDQLPASASVVVAGKGCDVLRIKFSDLDAFFAKNPAVQLMVYKQLAVTFSRRLRRSNQEIKSSFIASLGFIPDQKGESDK